MPDSPLRYSIFLLTSFLFIALGCSFSPPQDSSEPLWSHKTLVGAYYYLWYPGNWHEGYVSGTLTPPQWPLLGEYDSADIKTIEQHIAWSSQYGINFWAVSWWPGHPKLDRVLRESLLKAKNINDIKFCIFYETSGLGLADDKITFTPDKAQRLITDFQYLAKQYFNHPSYLKIKGRPAVIIYLTRTFSGDYPEAIKRLRDSLKQAGFDPYLIGDEIFWYVMRSAPLAPSTHPNMSRIKLFDAITAYNMYDWAKPQQMGYGKTSAFLREVRDLYQEYQSALGNDRVFIPSILPGYNDLGVRLSDNHPVIPRRYGPEAEEGTFFAQALQQTVLPFLDKGTPMALITSFNEWNEGTQIEPTIETAVTRTDRSPSRTEYTQGYAYQGYGKKYLSIVQDTFVAAAGQVLESEGGLPLSRVEVKIFQGEALKGLTVTDSRGFFNLSRFNLAPGDYEIKTRFPGYRENKVPLKVTEGKTALLQLSLKKQ
jgi:glycoprotein endo-alpha-1,2-mannosidase